MSNLIKDLRKLSKDYSSLGSDNFDLETAAFLIVDFYEVNLPEYKSVPLRAKFYLNLWYDEANSCLDYNNFKTFNSYLKPFGFQKGDLNSIDYLVELIEIDFKK